MVHEVNGFTDPVLETELREGTGRRSPRSIVADAIRHTAARAVPSRQSRPDDVSSAFALDADSLAPPGLDGAVPDFAALLGGLGAPTAIQSLTMRAPLPAGRAGEAESDLDALRESRVAALEQELRATLALISGYSQSLAHLTLDEGSRRRYLDQLPVAAAHLAGVTTEILEICGRQDQPAAPRPISLRRVSP